MHKLKGTTVLWHDKLALPTHDPPPNPMNQINHYLPILLTFKKCQSDFHVTTSNAPLFIQP